MVRASALQASPQQAAIEAAFRTRLEVLAPNFGDVIHQHTAACCLDRRGRITALALQSRRLTALGPLAALGELRFLALERNRIVDVRPLARLVKLRELTLFDNRVANPTPLAGLAALVDLNLSCNQIADLGAAARLARLPRLKELGLGYNPLRGVSGAIKTLMNDGAEPKTILTYLRALPVRPVKPTLDPPQLRALRAAVAQQVKDLAPSGDEEIENAWDMYVGGFVEAELERMKLSADARRLRYEELREYFTEVAGG